MPFHSADDVAGQLGVSRHFVYRLVHEGAIECHRFGRRVRFSKQQIADYVARCRVPARQPEEPISSLVAKHLGL